MVLWLLAAAGLRAYLVLSAFAGDDPEVEQSASRRAADEGGHP